MKNLSILIIAVLLWSCASEKKHVTHDETLDSTSLQDSLAKLSEKYKAKMSAMEFADEFNAPSRDEWQKPDSVLSYLGNVENKRILDLGAGTGYFSIKLAEDGAFVIAADVVPEYLDFINATVSEELKQNVETRLVPYESANLKNEEVDAVLLVDTYHQIEDRVAYFIELKRGITPSGTVLIVDPIDADCMHGLSSESGRLSKDVVIEEMSEAGFVLIDEDLELLDCQYVLLFKN